MVGAAAPEQIAHTVTILRERMAALDISGAEVASHGSGSGTRIVLTGASAGLRGVFAEISVTGLIEFRPLLLSGAPEPVAADVSPLGLKTVISPADQAAFNSLDCRKVIPTARLPRDVGARTLVTCATNGAEKYILGPTLIPGSDITRATAGELTNSEGVSSSEWVVNLFFDAAATSRFKESTREMFAQPNGSDGDRFAIVEDSEVLSAPSVNGVINDGRPQLAGSFTMQSAKALAAVLTHGSLPVRLVPTAS